MNEKKSKGFKKRKRKQGSILFNKLEAISFHFIKSRVAANEGMGVGKNHPLNHPKNHPRHLLFFSTKVNEYRKKE